ncbi:hypothetical protein DH2020_041448 [Rehmannia glutinosa]|uniref:WAT1-related protein n=1 Tax=Rehmannia glutinosa TaxID=99300 RepID=A0ABR0UQE9_REHGL
MSHYVLVVYRHAFATAVIAPFALVLERKVRPKITFKIFLQLFVLGLLGPVIDQNFYYAGLKFTSPTFSCAMSNMLPAMTFVMAFLCRMEKVDIKKVRCQAKVLGTIVTVGGAMLMTLYKGQVLNMVWSSYIHPKQSYVPNTSQQDTDKDWFKGSILLIIATLAWASFFILQAITMRKYTAHLSLTALVCFMGTLQSITVTFVMEQKPHAWAIGFDMNLLAAAYAALFHQALHTMVLGAILIVIGLYSVLWGKYKEYKEMEAEEILEPVKTGNNQNSNMIIEDIEANTVVEVQKNEVNRMSCVPAIAISGPMPQPPMLALEAPKP